LLFKGDCVERLLATFCNSIAVLGISIVLVSQSAGAQVRGAGATFPEPIYTKWFSAYKSAKGLSIDYQAVGSGAGYNALKNRTVDFGASDAPLTPSEEAALPEPVVHIPSVGGAVAITYNLPGAPQGLRLTPDVVAGIFLGRIKSWDDPKIKALNTRVNLPAMAIQPVHRTDSSGTTYIFTHYLKKANPDWAAGPGAGKSVNWPVGLGGNHNQGVAAELARTPGSIGYVELAYAISEKLPYAAIRNRAGAFVLPSVQSTTAAINQYATELAKDIKTPTVDAEGKGSYPICSLTYILIYRASAKPDVVRLWTWALEPAQQSQATSLYYAPLPGSVVKLNRAVLATVK
jgi:phosphate transport system substrate-binding protein